MFIEKISLKNLASLRGSWTLDFTDPGYRNGIFAITGSNGAGKSTLMDSICLALYGVTPRLNTFNTDCDEIMSKGTDECASEVTFRTAEGRFAAKWSHKRTGKNAKSAFQPVRCVFVQLSEDSARDAEGMVLSQKTSEVRQLVEKYTGLNFRQFMQTAMLAQFQFEQFLKCKTGERTAILETLTDTSVFRELVELAKAQAKNAEDELQKLTEQMDNAQLMTPEAQKALEEEFAKCRAEVEVQKNLQNVLAEELAEVRRWNELQLRIKSQTLEETQLAGSIREFQPHALRLERARKARCVRNSASDFQTKTRLLQECTANIQKLEKLIQTLELQQQEAQQREAETAESCRQAADRREEMEPRILQTRNLDVRLSEAKSRQSEWENGVTSAQNTLSECEKRRIQAEETVAKIRETLKTLRCSLPVTSDEEFQSFLREFSQLSGNVTKHAQRISKFATLWNEIRIETKTCEQISAEIQTLKTETDRVEAAVQAAEAAFTQVMKSYEEMQERRVNAGLEAREDEKTRNHRTTLEEILDTIQKTENNHRKLNSRVAENEKKRTDTTVRATEFEAAAENLALEIQNLNELQQKSLIVKNYEDARQHLHDGAPCPLCGATSHPYAIQNPMENSDQLAVQLHEKEALRKQAEKDAKTQRKEESRLTAELAADARSCQERDDELSRLTERLAAEREFFQLKTVDSPEVMQEFLAKIALRLADSEQRRNTLELEFLEIQKKLEHAQTLKKSHVAELEQARKRFDEALRRRNDAETRLFAKKNLWTENVPEFKLSGSTLAQAVRRYAPQCASKLGVFVLTLESEPDFDSERSMWLQILETLKTRYETQCEIQKNVRELEIAQNSVTKLETEAESARKSVEEKSCELKKCEEACRVLTAQRTELFGENDPNAVERGLKFAEQTAQTAWDAAKSRAQKLTGDCEHQAAELQKLRTSRDTAEPELRKLEEVFLQTLESQGFASPEDFHLADLAEVEIQKLEGAAQELQARKSRLEGTAQQNHKDLESFATPPARSESDVLTLREQVSQQIELLTQDIAQKQVALEMQKAALEKVGELRQKVRDVEAQSQRWTRLFKTLGGTNNSRSESFVNYVQKVTLNRLLHHANEQLRLLDPRYSLRMNPNDPTEIQISDSCQESATRSINTISGGETFLVSMALALGLTRMASRKVEINSFFIDEGFGSLASDKLENALSVLKTYNANASTRRGQKLIGIISHVNSIREEIETVISVKPFPPSNFSEIEGPGVSGSSNMR